MHREAAPRGVDGGAEAGQQPLQPPRRELGVPAGGGHKFQPLLAGVGPVSVVPPLLRVAERARLPDAVGRPGEERRVAVQAGHRPAGERRARQHPAVDAGEGFGQVGRDELRARLRQARPSGVPLLAEATAMIASYLTAERDLGRIAADADIDTLAPMLIGTGHLLFAGREGAAPEPGAVEKVVTTVIAAVIR
jgi:hypothetical protein